MIRLSPEDIYYIIKHLALPAHLKSALDQAQQNGGEISDDDADSLRDLCGDRLQTHGFDRNYEPTEEGRSLEALVDKLFIG